MNTIHGIALAVQYLIFNSIETGKVGFPEGASIWDVILPSIIILISMFVFICLGKDYKERLVIAFAGVRNLLYGFTGLYVILYIVSRKSGVSVQFNDNIIAIMWMGIFGTILYEIVRNKTYPNAY